MPCAFGDELTDIERTAVLDGAAAVRRLLGVATGSGLRRLSRRRAWSCGHSAACRHPPVTGGGIQVLHRGLWVCRPGAGDRFPALVDCPARAGGACLA